MATDVFARVGEPVLSNGDWVQAVQIIHANDAQLCTSREATTAALLAALQRDVGTSGFVIRAVDEEGVAIAVRFQRPWDDKKKALAEQIGRASCREIVCQYV